MAESPKKNNLKIGDQVIVQLPKSYEVGTIQYILETDKYNQILSKIIRKVNQEDLLVLAEIQEQEKKATKIFSEKVKVFKLSMKLLKTEISFDEKHLTFYFHSETRVDFRNLVKDLARIFKKMIRLQQVGPRDEAKIIPGFGPCGRQLCCQTFLSHLESVTSDFAKAQNLEMVSASKISGNCGKLLCCLSFEAENYQKLAKKIPEIGKIIKTSKGQGEVIERDILNQKVTVKLNKGQRVQIKVG